MDRNGSDSFHCHVGVPLLFLLFHWSCRSLNLVCQLLKSFYLAVVLVFFSHQWYLFQVPIGAAIFPFMEQYAEGGTDRWNLVFSVKYIVIIVHDIIHNIQHGLNGTLLSHYM